uniref:Uncharacterized protein isoform X1 n=3 Tax=Nicotiana tabacum TaxID=4097 RepID=A0A1S3Z9Q1_TOBAC|nr:PREDICTED: uncharacterized protein LOC107784450 isoform X1 [Nicotiana tabacum]XP_016461077.1 PREDICTED: uncharacterized protein LOC107784450 isoform X1 [Nicotiana tabacum]XP_016461084.1 PREDICTED: uncharacterized protein LOC107784450 isoform X1 [Nicotiana tabacum]XP_016461092.1 PREDICTED: uncharacterized protein LOC107784450 isoform X1 [Nicotiana tabacum]XP_016461100.1 PREDICTED: uncharacterized protein LOC107784450 isoform X1 [Nicotiana tabacum]XP_016461106.1 PREDICTED: uncharacterized pro
MAYGGHVKNKKKLTNVGYGKKRNMPNNIRLRSDYVPLKKVPNCEFCSAKKFQYESPSFCCANGTVKLTYHKMAPALRNLYLGSSAKSKHFQTYIRTYNNMFAFSSLGVSYDKDLAKRNRGIYTFRVKGQMYHFIDDLYSAERRPKNLQLYFYDNDNEIANRMACSDKINELIVWELIDTLKDNPYSIFLRILSEISNLQNYHIALKCNSGLDQRIFNLPSTTEVAAIWVDENDVGAIHVPHIQIYTHSNRTQRVNYYFGCYNPLQYPLLFPYGQSGWHFGIKKFHGEENMPKNYALSDLEQLPNIKNFTSVDGYLDMEDQVMQKGKRKRDTVSVREYYSYRLQMRNDDEDELLHTGRLLQQYSVDEYIKLETQRMDFVFFNQDLFRMDMLNGLLDILRLGERYASNFGKQTFLPNSFIGGPRDMRQRYMTDIALVQYFGKPDLFITMTCNPTWPEIEEHLAPSDEAQNRPDLISRVFRAKIEELKTDILKRNIFGKVVAFMYTVEFQK